MKIAINWNGRCNLRTHCGSIVWPLHLTYWGVANSIRVIHIPRRLQLPEWKASQAWPMVAMLMEEYSYSLNYNSFFNVPEVCDIGHDLLCVRLWHGTWINNPLPGEDAQNWREYRDYLQSIRPSSLVLFGLRRKSDNRRFPRLSNGLAEYARANTEPPMEGRDCPQTYFSSNSLYTLV